MSQFEREAVSINKLNPEDRVCNLDDIHVNYETGEREGKGDYINEYISKSVYGVDLLH